MADIVKGDEEWMVLDKEGKQPMLGQRYKPDALYLKLTSGKSKQWESVFKAVIKPECGGLCVLECKRCKEDVSSNNPSQAATRHKCKPAALAAAGVRSSPRKHHDLAHVAAFVLDPTNFIIEQGIIRTPYGNLSAKHKEEVLMLVVRLNGGRGDSNVIAAVSKELMELDMGDWHEVADVARHLVKRDYNADSAKLQIIVSPKPDFLRNFWLTKANKLFPLLAVAANKLLSAHATSCAAERNWSAWGRIYTSLRNKLDLETAEKLVYVKANMPEEWYS